MTPRDALALVLSFGYVILILAGAFLMRRSRASSAALRVFVHVAVGLWIVPTVLLFDTRWWAMAPPGAFVFANAVARPRSVYAAFLRDGRRDWGLVFFPAAVALCIGLWWTVSGRAPVVSGVLCLALGDSAASLVGRRWGKRRWRHLILHEAAAGGKTVEGSAALCVVCSLVAAGTLAAFAGVQPPAALAAGVVVGLAAAAAEALTPGRLDNLALPLVAALYTDLMLRWIIALGGAP